jgi:hypothetical protein
MSSISSRKAITKLYCNCLETSSILHLRGTASMQIYYCNIDNYYGRMSYLFYIVTVGTNLVIDVKLDG